MSKTECGRRRSFGRSARRVAPFIAGLWITCAPPTAPGEPSSPVREVGRLAAAIDESSGLVASRSRNGVIWTHNDSGDRPRIFAIRETGELLAEFEIERARHVDWEDIASDGDGNLYIADFGNNRSERRDLVVYRVPEPNPEGTRRSARADRALRFRYANQKLGDSPPDFDAEALVWHAGALYIFTKHRSDTRTTVYRLADVSSPVPQVLEPLGSLEIGEEGGAAADPFARATAADLSPDGRRVALLTYSAIYVYEREGEDLWPLRLVRRIRLNPLQVAQAESLTWDDEGLLFGNEQRQLFRIDPAALGTSAQP